jgi:hypothetical protein
MDRAPRSENPSYSRELAMTVIDDTDQRSSVAWVESKNTTHVESICSALNLIYLQHNDLASNFGSNGTDKYFGNGAILFDFTAHFGPCAVGVHLRTRRCRFSTFQP